MDNQATIDAIKRLANVGITARDAFDNFTKASARMRESMPSTKDWINYFNKRNNIMTNVEFLDINHCSELGDIRQRMNAEDENDTSFDDEINALTPQELAEKWAGWNLGSEEWATQIIDIYKAATENNNG